MRKLVMSFLAVVCMVSMFAGSVQASSNETTATWLWDPALLVREEANVLAFMEQKGINKVYVQIDASFGQQVYRSFISKAGAKGIQVYALDGAPAWATRGGRAPMVAMLDWVKKYQASAKADEKFAGVHLDVEPYIHPHWVSKQREIITNYQKLLLDAKALAKQIDLPLEADIPFWFDEINYRTTYGRGNLAEWVIANTDGATIMAYRDTAALIYAFSKQELDYATKYGKKLSIGVETMWSAEGNQVSFSEEGEAYMHGELQKVREQAVTSPGFGGFAIHHFDSWRNMKQ
ncbi:amidase [Paenalkalicoccus suaedae]|uniref:Amidase n=1 Tax=Paenalkalicoccus suaedae TaxID=2592382 RepID=A0A859FA92_9BACI|nr:amidase [Paenalkalicoccus suaedae]QKS69810.1 amidase [Paenalkalicoccus suaedae]